MPYISKPDRAAYEAELIDLICKLTDSRPGDINYVISSIVWRIFSRKPSYTVANTLIGVLECVKLELYRRQVAPYEDKKIQENGDIV